MVLASTRVFGGNTRAIALDAIGSWSLIPSGIADGLKLRCVKIHKSTAMDGGYLVRYLTEMDSSRDGVE